MNTTVIRLMMLRDQLDTRIAKEWDILRHTPRDERGSVTIETVLWAVAVIAFVAIVVTVIRAFITKEAGKIK